MAGEMARTRVNGSVSDDGSVRCACGKKVGQVRADGVEFHCPRCKVDVHLDFARMKVAALTQAMQSVGQIAAMISAIGDPAGTTAAT